MVSQPQSAVELFEHLITELREAKRLYLEVEDAGRAGVRSGLDAVIGFLQCFRQVDDENLSVPLVALSGALYDLDRGVPTPLLPIGRRRGRKANSLARLGLCGAAALTLDLLMRTGLTQMEAAKRVADLLNKLGVTRHGGRGGAIRPKTVINWREQISADYGKGVSAEFYEELRGKVKFPEGADLGTIRRDLLLRLKAVVSTVRAADEKPGLTPE